MNDITDWREAFSFLRRELINELMHAGLQENETQKIETAILTAFRNLDQKLGNDSEN